MVLRLHVWKIDMDKKGPKKTLREAFPSIANQWYQERNGTETPDTIGPYCRDEYWWICDLNHIWKQSPKSRINTSDHRPHGCPYCSNKEVWPGFNDLETKNPKVASEWDYSSNKDTPRDVASFSHKSRYFICPICHQSYLARISDRTLHNSKCNICNPKGNNHIKAGFNDLEHRYPCIAQYWDTTRNEKKASEVLPNSHESFWWTDGETSWKSSPNRFVQKYRLLEGHPDSLQLAIRYKKIEHSSSYYGISFPEKVAYFYLQKAFPDAIENYVLANGTELDIYIPSLSIGVEYDGKAFHTKKRLEKDIEKNIYCKKSGIHLIRLREIGCPDLQDEGQMCIAVSPSKDGLSLKKPLEILFNSLANNNIRIPSIDIERDYADIVVLLHRSVVANSLKKANPPYLAEWDYEKNGEMGITPDMIAANSNAKVYWRCSAKGHPLFLSPNARNTAQGACGICANKKTIPGINDFATIHKDLLKYWDYSKNKIKPTQISAGASYKAYWVCVDNPKHNGWVASVFDFVNGKSHCPQCSSGHKLSIGENDLLTKAPEIAKDWDYNKNKNDDGSQRYPYEVMAGSEEVVWWINPFCHHSFDMSVCSKIKYGRKTCPYCSGKRVLKGFNDLKSQNNVIAEEWDYELNDISPEEVTLHSTYKAHWICRKNPLHKWSARVCSRTSDNHGTNCPLCSGNLVIKGVNDLATENKEIAEEWDFELNEGNLGKDGKQLTPYNVSSHSGYMVWWRCKKDSRHFWPMKIGSRTGNRPQGCSVCSGRRIIPHINDFATLYPEVYDQWDFEKNVNVDPFTLGPSDNKNKYYWKKENGESDLMTIRYVIRNWKRKNT